MSPLITSNQQRASDTVLITRLRVAKKKKKEKRNDVIYLMSALDGRGAACGVQPVTVPAVSWATDRRISAA